MAVTSVASANNVQQWDEGFFYEYVRADQFGPYSGKGTNNVIQIREKLVDNPGDQITISLVTRLTDAGVTGDNTLEGNEEAIGNYGYKLTVSQLRHAVRMGHGEQKKTHIDMLKAAAPLLKDWRLAKHRSDVIASLLCPNVDGTTAYASTSEANKDIWLAANSDRVLFGNGTGNYSGDHDTDLAKVDSTDDTLDSGIVSVAKRMAQLADPHIRPIQVDGFGEMYVMFAGSYAMRDLRADSTIVNSQQYALARSKDNPLFRGGDVMWDNVLVHEVPEIDTLTGVGGGSINVAPCFLCGAQALGYAIGERTHSIKDEWDYMNQKGVGIAEIRKVAKLIMNSKQHGMVTVYVSGVADS
jgi:N4-gp56 family major capsid protein